MKHEFRVENQVFKIEINEDIISFVNYQLMLSLVRKSNSFESILEYLQKENNLVVIYEIISFFHVLGLTPILLDQLVDLFIQKLSI